MLELMITSHNNLAAAYLKLQKYAKCTESAEAVSALS